MKKKNILIIGLGGVGGYFGFKINKYNEDVQELNIVFIARNQTFHAIKENGLVLLSPEFTDTITRPNALFEDISDAIEPDLVIICVKEYDLENVCRKLKSVITKETILLPLMNGVDIYDRIRKIIPGHTLLPTCVYVAAHIQENGVIEHKGKPGKIIIGKDVTNAGVPLEWVIDIFQKSQIEIDFHENPYKAIWTKFLFISSFGLVTAKHNSSFGAICNDPVQKQEAIEIMNEVKAIANAKEVVLDDAVVENTFRTAMSFPYQTPSSIQLDIHRKRKSSELDLLAGTILRYGKELHIETPCTSKIFSDLNQILSH